MQSIQLQTAFLDREALTNYVREQFPVAARRSPEISPIHGGRIAAEKLIQRIQPERYAATRNMFDGAVTHLSPYLRHGIITLAEVRHAILEHTSPQKAYKLLQELAWRDYYQRVYERLGNDIWRDIEPYKTGVRVYAHDLPGDIAQGTTGAVCIDAFSHDLQTIGYLHNHARMWIAAYVVHHRRVRWQAGAYWFLQHLLDGDPASNNLSWQWVASTFAAKPYFFNRENLARYTENAYCSVCPLAQKGCPFEGTYEEVAKRIFPATSQIEPAAPETTLLTKRLSGNRDMDERKHILTQDIGANAYIVWINEESLNPYGPALTAHAQQRNTVPIFVFDESTIEAAAWSIKRIVFLYESLLEISNIRIYRGSTLDITTRLLAELRQQHGEHIAIATTPVVEPRLQQLIFSLEKFVPVEQHAFEPFAPVEHIRDLRRFSRYWNEVERVVVGSRNRDEPHKQ